MQDEQYSEYAVIRDKLPARRAFLLHLEDDDEYELVGIVDFETGNLEKIELDEVTIDFDDYPFLYTVKQTDWYCHIDDHAAMINKYVEESVKDTLKKLNM